MNVTCTGAHCIVDKSTKIVLHQQNITNITFTFNNEWNDLEKKKSILLMAQYLGLFHSSQIIVIFLLKSQMKLDTFI